MNTVKKFFPHALKADNVTGLVVAILIYALVNFICGFVLGIFSHLPLIGFVASFLGWALGIYCAVGVILSVLIFLHIIK